MRYAVVPFLLLALTGCDFDKSIARAESAVATAQQGALRAEAAMVAVEQVSKDAKKALAVAEQIAASTGSEQAIKAVASAKEALSAAEAVLPSIKAASRDASEALAAAQAGVAAAKAAKEAGGSGWEILLGAAAAFVPMLIPVVRLAQNLNQARTAVKLTAAHADAMEAAETDADVATAKANAVQSQVAAKVHGLIQNLRGK
jgi:hypothetical protein